MSAALWPPEDQATTPAAPQSGTRDTGKPSISWLTIAAVAALWIIGAVFGGYGNTHDQDRCSIESGPLKEC